MTECKKALTAVAAQGCAEAELMDLAVDFLRKQGTLQSSKTANRTASEGLVAAVALNAGKAALVLELNCETDFVSRNAEFQKFLVEAAEVGAALASRSGKLDLDTLFAAPSSNGSVRDALDRVVVSLREKLELRRVAVLEAEADGLVIVYVHNLAPQDFNPTISIGRIATMVAISPLKAGAVSPDQLQQFGASLALHVTAASPLYVSKEQVDQAALDREGEIVKQQALALGKQGPVLDKIVQGRMAKFFSENCLLDQQYVLAEEGDKITVGALLKKNQARVTSLLRWQVGDGVAPKQAVSFAAEVASIANQ